ncbi:tetratricopeptide repeat protein 16-like [Sphaeramia orbicularis]|uniref:tetratricopeptide repeat protein 16-like n=1 Tax=Sphaeramia orbicularis TaxID=375764 RepID=UPI00117F22BE|nr:tetratricopeptide repeat protein 16 [Sphaeramia orbicularis]
MATSEEVNDQKHPQEGAVFPTAVSEEELDEAKRKTTMKQPFGRSQKCFSAEQQQSRVILQNTAAEHFIKGIEAFDKLEYERAVIWFNKAINLQPQQPHMFVSRGDAFLHVCDFQSAADSYTGAAGLCPGVSSDRLAFVYFLQGQCLLDRGLFLEALDCFSKAAELKPGCRVHQVRRLACLSAAGRQTDCLKLVNDWMASDGPSSDLYVLRARLHKRLNQTSRCYEDVKAALALKPWCPEAGALLLTLQDAAHRARRAAVDRAATGRMSEALVLINVALENCPQEPRLHLFRGTLCRRMKDFGAAIADLVHTVELSEDEEGVGGQGGKQEEEEEAKFQLVLTYNDLAVQCFCRGLYEEATLLLNKAIEDQKNQAGLYLNRGDCFYKQEQWCYALADYQQAEELIGPDRPSVRLRLAVLHNTLGSLCFQDGRFQDAAFRFTVAIGYNPTVGRYYKNRAKAFRKILKVDQARKDFICTLVLDPDNQELPSMLTSLFPGRSMSDVLSSPAGRAVRSQLMDAVRAYEVSSQRKGSDLEVEA